MLFAFALKEVLLLHMASIFGPTRFDGLQVQNTVSHGNNSPVNSMRRGRGEEEWSTSKWADDLAFDSECDYRVPVSTRLYCSVLADPSVWCKTDRFTHSLVL